MSWYTRLWKYITLAHGAGGRETSDIIEQLIRRKVPREYWRISGGTGLDELDDSALIPVGENYLAVTIDDYTVKPVKFPGGDLGVLAASGTINDLLMVGAKPLAALDGIIVEEGLSMEDLDSIIESYINTLVQEGVALIGGDFKVMPKGQLDGIVIASAGIGIVEGKPIRDSEISPGDKIIVSGYIGDHGAAILSAQKTLGVEFDVKSDVRPLSKLMLPLLNRYRDNIHAANDPTRGGLAMTLNDWAKKSGNVILLEEERVPIREQVREYSEMLGVDPLSLASEGVAVLAVEGNRANEILSFIKSLGFTEAEIIGIVKRTREENYAGRVIARSVTGGYRIVEPPSGEIVPRIC